MRASKSNKSYAKEDGISMNDKDERRAAAWSLMQIKRKMQDKEFIPVKIFNGYKFIEKSKYERIYANDRQNTQRRS